MKPVLAALFAAVIALFSTAAKADTTLEGGFSMQVENVTSDEGTSFKTTLRENGQVVWSGSGLVLAVTPKTLVVDQITIAHAHAFHATATYRWDGQKYGRNTPVAGFTMQVEQHRLPTGVMTFTTILSFPGYAQTKEVPGIVQDIHMGKLYVDQVTVTAEATTHQYERFTMGHW
jgi:hypothetical protein